MVRNKRDKKIDVRNVLKIFLFKHMMPWNTLYTSLVICFWILTTYIHILAELDAIEEYNTSLYDDQSNKPVNRYMQIAQKQDIDMVYTWVNGSEEKFMKDLDDYVTLINKPRADVLALNRYLDFGSLKFSLRSVEKYANWIRHIFLVTNGQVPEWLNRDNPRITVVTHEELFSNKSHLPTFASPAIECHLHKIKGLSEHFIYMNDDIILTSRLDMSDFYTDTGKYKLRFMKEKLERCNRLCGSNNVNNGICESDCNSGSCEFDGDDCVGVDVRPYTQNDSNFMFDSWIGGMMHTHFLFNKAFGPVNRYIPEHGPHLFNKNIIKQLSIMFPVDWDRTSSNKIRHHLSIQYQFAYNNFLLVLEEIGVTNIQTNVTFVRECCNKDILEFDSRGPEARRKQIEEAKKRLVLMTPKYLVVTTRFIVMLNEAQQKAFTKEVTDFLGELLPLPSMFEIKS